MLCRSRIIDWLVFVKTIAISKKNLSSFGIWQSRNYLTSNTKWTIKAHLTRFPVIMRIHDSPQFIDCMTKEVLMLRNMFTENGHEIRIVGGAVRDLLLGIKPEDLDFATTATPEEMKEMFLKNDIRLINSNGEKHGTITARIEEKNFEVTTLRIDVVTNGRHADVLFTKNWLLDAKRRDLTINAMYLDFNGNLYDYFDGYEDLKHKKIRFVGNADERIQEDYLRILRYFRFYGKIAEQPDNHNKDVMVAISENAKGLENISGERIWTELNKILTGNFIYEILLEMIKLKVGLYIGFPKTCNIAELKNVTERLKKNQITVKPMTVLASLFDCKEDVDYFCDRIKPSSFDRNLIYFILFNRQEIINEKPLRLFQKYIINSNNSTRAFAYSAELLKYKANLELLNELEKWKIPKFPVDGNMLRKEGVTGKNIGLVLNKLKNIWIDHDFNIEEQMLLEHVPDVLANLSPQDSQRKNLKGGDLLLL